MLDSQDSPGSMQVLSRGSSGIFLDSSRIFSSDTANFISSDNSSPDYALLAIKRWKLVFVVTLLGFCASYLALSRIPKKYESSAMVKLGSYTPPAEGPVGRQIQAETEKHDYLVSQVAMIKSYTIADGVLKSNPAISQFLKQKSKTYTETDLLENYQKMIEYEMVAGTSLIKITSKAGDPFLAEKIANAHAKQFITLIQSSLSKLAKTNLFYLKKRANEVEEQYTNQENAALAYAKTNSLAGSDVEQVRKTLVQKYQSLYGRLNQVILQRARSESEYRELRNAPSQTIRFNPEVSKEFTRLSTLESQIKSFKRFGTQDSDVFNQIKDERNSLVSALKDFNSRKAEASGIELKAANETESIIRKELKRTITEERELYGKMVDFSALKEKAESLKIVLRQVQARLDDAQLNAKNNQHIITLVDRALVPSGPSSPNRGLFLGFGLMGSLILGIFLTIAIDSVDQTIGSVSDVEKCTSMSMLGMIPSFHDSSRYGYGYGDEPGEIRKTFNSLSGSLTNILAAGDIRSAISKISSAKNKTVGQLDKPQDLAFKPLVAGEKESSSNHDQTDFITRDAEMTASYGTDIPVSDRVLTYTRQWSRLSEAFNEVFITLQSLLGEKAASILVTSADKGDGKSTVAANLAVSFANAGKRTILIDSDFRLPTLNNYFDFSENLVGLSDYLLGHIGAFDSVYKTQAANLSIIPVGTYIGAYSQLGSGKKFKELIELLSDQYDVILIDGPPILHVADGLAISRVVDGVALVVRNGKTRRETAKWVVGRLAQVGGKVLGIVYNDVPNAHSFSRYSY